MKRIMLGAFFAIVTPCMIPCTAVGAESAAKPYDLIDPDAKLPYPEKQYTGDRWYTGSYMRKLRRIRDAEGNAAAAARIPAAWKAWKAYIQAVEPKGLTQSQTLDEWGFWVWHEAQHDSGTEDKEWEMLLYKSIYDVAKAEKRFDWMMHVRANLVNSYLSLCQWANARAILNEAEDYYKSIGFDLDPSKHPLEGEWDPMVPLVKTRNFPMMLPNGQAVVYWQRAETRRDASKPVFLDNMLTSLMLALADEDQGMGQWDKAIERCTWVRRWSNAVKKHNAGVDKKSKVVRESEDQYWSATLRMTGILLDLDFTEKARVLIDDGLARQAESKYGFRDRIQLEIRKERVMVEYGKENAAFLAKMDKFIALEGTSPHLVAGTMDAARIYKVQCLRTLGRLDEAEKILRAFTARDQRQRAGWLGPELYLVEIMQDRGDFAKAKATLLDLMNALRITGRKTDELALYRAYVSWAFRSGNWEEALYAHREVIRLVEAFRMTPLIPHEQAVLSRIMAELGDQAESDRLADLARAGAKGRESRFVAKIDKELAARPVKKVVSQKSKVLMQPRRVISSAIEGFAARTVVTLVNRGGKQAEGVLKVKGLPAKISWNQQTGLGVVEVANTPGPKTERVSDTIRIDAGAIAIFSCLAGSANKTPQTVIFEWIENNETAAQCQWVIETDDKESEGAIIDAAEYGDDPFFLIPVYHHLQSKSKDPVNLRVVASQPCRVEMYDGAGVLQMVDAEANGSLADRGDWLGLDRDRNLAPEMLPDPKTGETCFLLQLDPKNWNGKEPLKIRVEWLVNGKWHPAAEDQVVSGK